VGSAAGPAFIDLPGSARQRGTGKHAVFGADPAFSAIAHEGGNRLFH
jgi:hypothetical protein